MIIIFYLNLLNTYYVCVFWQNHLKASCRPGGPGGRLLHRSGVSTVCWLPGCPFPRAQGCLLQLRLPMFKESGKERERSRRGREEEGASEHFGKCVLKLGNISQRKTNVTSHNNQTEFSILQV